MTDESQVYTTGGHLTVRRDLHAGTTRLSEIWELQQLAWTEENVGEYDIVKCHVADFNEVPNDGVPHPDHRVTDSCSFEEAPKEVQEEFIKQAENLRNALDEITQDSETGEEE